MAKPVVEVCPEFRPVFKRGKFCGFCKCTELVHKLMNRTVKENVDAV